MSSMLQRDRGLGGIIPFRRNRRRTSSMPMSTTPLQGLGEMTVTTGTAIKTNLNVVAASIAPNPLLDHPAAGINTDAAGVATNVARRDLPHRIATA